MRLSVIGTVGALLESGTIQDHYSTAFGPDQTVVLQSPERDCHPRAANAQHQCKELVGQRQLVAVDPIVRHPLFCR
jgi:hypothetical protein